MEIFTASPFQFNDLSQDQQVGEDCWMDHLNTFTEFQADLISFTVSPGKIETNTLEHPELNTFHHFKSRVCCKSAEAAFYVFGENRDMLSQNISNLVSAALKTTISLGNSNLIWRAVLTKYSTEETGIDCYSQVELSFDVMESLPLTTVKLKGNDTILNAGNCTSECIISFTPTKEMAQFSIRNLFTINKPEVGKTIVIDSMKKTVTADGVNIWPKASLSSFPTLSPGLNKIEMVPEPLEVTFSYYPMLI